MDIIGWSYYFIDGTVEEVSSKPRSFFWTPEFCTLIWIMLSIALNTGWVERERIDWKLLHWKIFSSYFKIRREGFLWIDKGNWKHGKNLPYNINLLHILTLLILITLTKVEYTLSIIQIYWKYSCKVYLKYTSNILEAYFKYTSSILQHIELKKKKYTSSLSHFDKNSTFKAHFVKLGRHFNVNLKYTSSKYTLSIL